MLDVVNWSEFDSFKSVSGFQNWFDNELPSYIDSISSTAELLRKNDCINTSCSFYGNPPEQSFTYFIEEWATLLRNKRRIKIDISILGSVVGIKISHRVDKRCQYNGVRNFVYRKGEDWQSDWKNGEVYNYLRKLIKRLIDNSLQSVSYLIPTAIKITFNKYKPEDYGDSFVFSNNLHEITIWRHSFSDSHRSRYVFGNAKFILPSGIDRLDSPALLDSPYSIKVSYLDHEEISKLVSSYEDIFKFVKDSYQVLIGKMIKRVASEGSIS